MDEKDAMVIMADMRRKKEDAKTANKNATFFVAIAYLIGFILMIYLGELEILAYISIFVFLLFALVFHNFKECKKDIEAIDELFLTYEYNKNKK